MNNYSKLICSIFFILTGLKAAAQDDFKTDVLKLMQISGSTASTILAKDKILSMISATKHEAVVAEFEKSLPDLFDKIATSYMLVYTHNDVKKMILFYESDIGKKIASKSQDINLRTQIANKEWAESLSTKIEKYLK